MACPAAATLREECGAHAAANARLEAGAGVWLLVVLGLAKGSINAFACSQLAAAV